MIKKKNKKKVNKIVVCLSAALMSVPIFMGNTSNNPSFDSTLLNRVVTFKSEPDFYELIGGMGNASYDLDFFITVNGIRYQYNVLTFAQDYYANGGNQLFYGTTFVYSSSEMDGFDGWLDSDLEYATITITGGDDVENVSLISALYAPGNSIVDSIIEYYPPIGNLDIYDSIYDLLNQYLFEGQISQEDSSYKNLVLTVGATTLSFFVVCLPFIAIFAVIKLFFN